MDLNLLSNIPIFVYLLLALGVFLLSWFYRRLIIDEQRVNLKEIQGSSLRQLLAIIPFFFLYLNFIPNARFSQIVLLVLGLGGLLFYIVFLFSDIKLFKKADFSSKAVWVYIAASSFLLLAFSFFIYYTFIYLGQNSFASLEILNPFLLILLPFIVLLSSYRQRKEQSLSADHRLKLMEANREELAKLNIVFGLISFLSLLIGIFVLQTFFDEKGNSLSSVFGLIIFVLVMIAIFGFRYIKQQEILSYYGLPQEYLQAQGWYEVLVLVTTIFVGAISFLVRYYFL